MASCFGVFSPFQAHPGSGEVTGFVAGAPSSLCPLSPPLPAGPLPRTQALLPRSSRLTPGLFPEPPQPIPGPGRLPATSQPFPASRTHGDTATPHPSRLPARPGRELRRFRLSGPASVLHPPGCALAIPREPWERAQSFPFSRTRLLRRGSCVRQALLKQAVWKARAGAGS